MTTRHRSAEARPETAIGAGRVRSRQLIAIAATAVAYLLWRVGWTLGTASPWFSVALLLLEVWAIGQLIVTAAVLRGGRRVPEPAVDLSNAVPEARDIAVVIDAATGSPDALRRTLVSMGETTTASSFVVILAEDDPVAASSIARAGGSIRVDPAPDRAAAFWAAAVAEERPFALWLEAGDVVTPSTLTRLAEHFVDADVAVVQGSVGLINADSFLHLREGHDEAAYERDVLLPALGRVGAAPWNGSGSMCRVEAIATIGGLDEGPGSREAAVARLHQRRLTTRHEAEPVIRRTAPDTIADYLRERQCQARDRLRLRAMAPGRPNRLARLALADTHLRSIRQFVATWLLVVALFVAPEPVSGSVPLWIAVAVVVHGLCAWARHSAAAGTMRWGDWVRQGWRTVGADLAGAASRKPRSAGRGSASGVKTLGRLRLATFTLVAIDVAVLARAATLIDPDLLPRFGTVTRFAALGAALLCIVALVDVMQVIVRRRQRRADHRIAVPLSAIVDENYCETSDLSPSGVGLVLSESRDVGSSITMTLAVPRLDGSVAAVDLDGTVRHTRPLAEDEDGLARHLVGVQFGELMPEAWSALFTYCAIVHPAGLDRRIDPEPIIGPATLDIRHSRLQKVMGPVSVMAGVLAAGTMFFGPGAGAAFASTSVGEARACVLSSDGSGRAGGLVQMHFDGVWNDIATTDESGCVALAVPRQGVVPVQVVLDGRTERIDQDLLWDPSVVFETTEVVVEVVSSSGEPVEGARVQWHGAVWRDAGRTGVDGTARFETWDQTIPVQVVLDGRTKRIDQNVRWDPRIVFETTEVVVEVVSSTGAPVDGAQVQWHSAIWREAGRTGVDGTVRFETWDQTIPVQVWLNGRVHRIDQNVGVDPTVVFETTEVVVEVTSSTGEPIEGAVVEWHGGVWRRVGGTGADGTVRFETWAQTIPVQVTLNARIQRKDQNIARTPVFAFETVPLPDEFVEDTVQYHNGQWRIFRADEEFLPGALLLQRADSTTHTITLVSPRPEPEPEPTPTPLPEPTPEPTTQPDTIAEPTPVAGSGTETSEATPSTPTEPAAEPTPSSDDGPAPLVLDLPDAASTTGTGPDNGSPPPSTDTVPPPVEMVPPPVMSVPPPSDAGAPPPADPSGPDESGTGDDGIVVIIRPIAPSSESAETDLVSFDLEVTNQSTRRAEAPVVVDVDLGAAITPTTVDSDAWRCSHESGRLRCVSADPIDPGSRSTIAVTGQSPDGAAPTDLAMAAESSAVSVTTGDELGAPASAGPAAVAATAPTVRVVVDGRTSPLDTLTLVLLLAIAVGVWSGRLRRGKAGT